MDHTFKLFGELPALWAIGGWLMGAVITWFFSRKLSPIYGNAVRDLSGIYELQISAHQKALEMQKCHYEMELGEVKADRDDYRTKLHAEKEAHNATNIKLQAAESRPNIDGLSESFRRIAGMMEDQAKTMKAIQEAMTKLSQ